MTRNEASQLWQVVKAYAEGLEIQVRVKSPCDPANNPWEDYRGNQAALFNENLEWRVKPKPREFWIFDSDTFGKNDVSRSPVPGYIHVIEIIESK